MKRVSSAFPRRAWLAALGAVVLLAGVAGLRAAVTTPASPGDVATAPEPAAMRVAIDPETGTLGPVSDAAAPSLALPKSAGPLPPVEIRADGSEVLHVKGHFRNVSLARIATDGRLETQCCDDPAGAHRFLCGETPAPVAPRVSAPASAPVSAPVLHPIAVEVK